MPIHDKFITDMLNIDADKIESINTRSDAQGNLCVDVKLKLDEKVKCKVCDGKVTIHGYNTKTLIHSIFMDRKCTIYFKRKRLYCPNCDLTFSEDNPFASNNERLTYETKANILKDLKRCANTYNYVAIKNNVSVTEVIKVFDKHVDIKRHTLPEALSIDEHYFPRSDFDSLYICVLMDFKTGEIVDVLKDRKKDYLSSYFSNIKNATLDEKNHTSELSGVKYISMDLNDIYRIVCKIWFPRSTICADEFHVIKNLNKFFNDVRLRCRRNANSDTLIYLLTKFDYVLFHDTNLDNKAQYNKRLKRYINLRGIQEMLFDAFSELKTAYELKEAYIIFNKTSTLDNAKEELEKQIKSFENSNIKEYLAFASLLNNWKDEIVNSFIMIDGKRINNSYIESKNKNIETLFFNANGMSNSTRVRNRIMYCLNKKDTYKM